MATHCCFCLDDALQKSQRRHTFETAAVASVAGQPRLSEITIEPITWCIAKNLGDARHVAPSSER